MKFPTFRNARLFRLGRQWAGMNAAFLDDLLGTQMFVPMGKDGAEPHTTGWAAASPFGATELVYAWNGCYLLNLRTESKVVPSAAVKARVQELAEKVEHSQGFKPGRKQMREIKEDALIELRAKALTTIRDTPVLINTIDRLLIVDTASGPRCDIVMQFLHKCVDGDYPITFLQTKQSPGGAMTAWLLDDEAPANFTVDQSTTLTGLGQDKAKVRYDRRYVDPKTLHKLINDDDMQVARLAMTWADRMSFTLGDDQVLRSIKMLDVIREHVDADTAEDQFQSDFTLFNGEFAKLVADLVEALGGEVPDDPAADL
jgi:recombination associated protein RdgC